MTFSETLDARSVPSASAFKVLVGDSTNARRVSQVKILGATVEFTLNIFVQRGDSVTVEYCASGTDCGGPIQSQDGSQVFTSYGALTPITTPGTPPTVSGTLIDAYTITIDFNKTLDSATIPDGSAFQVTGFTTTVRKVVISGMKVVLHVLPPMPPWRHSYDPGLTYTPPSTNSLRTPTPAAYVAGFTRSSINNNNGKLVVSGTAIDDTDIELTFRVDIDENRLPANDKFKACPAESSADSACNAATAVSVSGKVVTVTFPSSALPSGATVWLRYSGTRLRGKSGARTEVRRITAHPISVPSTAAPVFVSGAADGTSVALTFDSALDSTSTPPASSFEVNDSAPSAVSVSGTQVALTLAIAVAEGEDVSVEYTATGTPKLQGANGTAVAAFTEDVDNNTDTAPAPSSASVAGTALSITFDQPLDTTSVPAATSFSVSVGGVATTVNAVALSGSIATLTLAGAVEADDAVTVSYTQPASGGLQDSTMNRTASFGPLTATNRAAPAPSAASVDGAALTLTFNADLDTTATPLAAAFAVAGHTISVPTVTARAVTLTLSPAVAEGATISLSYDPTQAGSSALRGANRTAVAAFSALAVTNQTDTAPAYVSGKVNGATVTLTFDQNLDATSVPPVVDQGRSTLSALRVTVNELRVGFSLIQVSNQNVVISLLAAVTPADAVKVQYQLQTNSPLQDTSTPANPAPSFDPMSLTNITLTTASSAQITGWTITVAFSGALDTDPLPASSAFTVTSGDDSLTVSSVSASASTLTLRLSTPVSRTAQVRVAYTVPATNPLQDASNRSIAAFTLNATNNTPAAPTVASAIANGTTVTISFNRALSSASTTAVAAFMINSATASGATVQNGKLMLTAAQAFREGAAVTVAYTPSASAKLHDQHGLAVAAFSKTATNNTDTTPVASSATAVERSVAIVFDQNLDTTSAPPKTAFSLGSSAPTVTAVSISGKTVTLSVACCILPATTLQLTYTADSSKPLQDPTANAVSNFTINVTNRSRQGPSVSSATATGDKLRIAFSATLDRTATPAASSFTITAGEQTINVSSVAISASQVSLTLGASIAGDQTVSLTYKLPATNQLSGTDGSIVAPFTTQSVTNQSPPLLTSATVNGSTLTLQFDTALDTTVSPDAVDFSLTGATASSVAVSGSTVQLTLSAPVAESAAVRIAYTPSEENTKGIEGANGVRLGAVAERDVDNTTDTTPVVSRATINLATIQVVFDQALDSANVPAATAFAVGPSTIGIESVAINGNTLTLTLASPVAEGAAATLAYTVPTTNALQDGTGNEVAQFSITLVNQTDTAPVIAASAVDGATLTLTFDQALNTAFTNVAAQFTITGTSAASVAINGKVATVTLGGAVADGASIQVQYTKPASGGLQDATGNAVASFTTSPVNGTDNAPAATSATIASDGVTLTIAFSESLSEATNDLPPSSQFTLTGTTSVTSGVAVSGAAVTLALSTSVKEGEVISVAYAATGTNVLRDADQGQLGVAAFSISADNQVDYAPSPTSAAIDGTALTITFDQALDTTATVTAAPFAVSVGGSAVTVEAVAISGSQVTLTLAQAATAAETVTVSYTKPATGGIQDSSSLLTDSFGPLTVTNQTAPALQSATVDGDSLVLTFDVALDAQATPPKSAFTINFATVSSVAVSNRTVTLRLAAAVHETATSTLFYSPPASAAQRLKGSNGAEVPAMSSVAVENQTDTTPVVVAAVVQLNQATITFDQDLNTTKVPAATLFSLEGSSRTVESVAVQNDALTGLGVVALSLSGNVREGAAITIKYVRTGGATGFEDPEANVVDAFSVAAENTTDTAPSATAGSVDGSTVVVAFDQPLDLSSVPLAAKFSLSGTTASATAVRLRNDDMAKSGTLELTLGTAVAEGAVVALTYAAPTAAELAAQPGLKYLRDQQGNAASISNFALTNLTDTAPAVVSATVNGASLTIAFDQPLDATSKPAATAFTLTNGATASAVGISGSEVTLTLAAPVGDGDALRLSYSLGTGNRIRDLSGNDAAAFSMDVQNATDTAPVAQSAVADGEGGSLTLTMSEAVALATGSGSLKDALSLDGSEAVIDSVGISGASVTLSFTTDEPVHELDTITLRYAPAAGAVRLLDADQGGLAVANFSIAVTNNVDTVPIVETASIDFDLITLEFDQPLVNGPGPPYLDDIGEPLNAFRVLVGGAPRAFANTTVQGGVAYIRLLESVSVGQTVTIQYQLKQPHPLTDASDPSNNVASFDPEDVTNATAAQPTAAQVDGATLRITFDAALSAAAPAAASFTVSNGGDPVIVDSAATSGSTLTLGLSAAMPEGALVRVAYTPPEMMALLDGESRAVRAFDIEVDNVTDTVPVVVQAEVVGDRMTVTFDQGLVGVVDADDFVVSDTDGTVAATNAQLASAELSLTLARRVVEGSTVQVQYTKPSRADHLRDGTGNALASFNIEAMNATALGPRAVSAEARLTELVVNFNKPLDGESLPTAGDFSITRAPAVVEVIEINGATLTLRLAEPGAGPDSRIRLTYMPGARAALRDMRGTPAEGFTIGVVDRGSAPTVTRVVVAHEVVGISFDRPLSPRHVPPRSWWFVAGRERIRVAAVGVSGSTVSLVLASPGAPDADERVVVSYSPRSSGSSSLRGIAGHRVAGFAAVAQNLTRLPPTPLYAMVDGRTLTVEFSEPVAAGMAQTDWFEVTAGRRAASIVSIAWSERSATFRFMYRITAREFVTLRYAPRSDDGVRDANGKLMEPFEIEVENRTRLAATLDGRVVAAAVRALNDPSQSLGLALRRELVRELAWRGGVYAVLDATARRWDRVAHELGAPAFTLRQMKLAKRVSEAQIEVRRVGHRALLGKLFDIPTDWAWERDSERLAVLSVWRADLTDRRGTPLDGSATVLLELPLPDSETPLAAVVLDLQSGTLRRVEYERNGDTASLQVTIPAAIAFVALPMRDVTLWPGVTPLRFEGEARITAQVFAASLDSSVIGVGMQDEPGRHWDYIPIDDPGEHRLLRWGERILIVRGIDAEPIMAAIPSPLILR